MALPLNDRPARRSLLVGLTALAAAPPRLALAQPVAPPPLRALALGGVALSGVYAGHLQGVCTNDRDAIYWSMTTSLVKTDTTGAVVRQIPVPGHHGDLCHVDGRIYVAVNLGLFNDPQKRADSWVYVYDAGDLSLLVRHAVPDLVYGAGGVAFGDGRFIVVGGLPEGAAQNQVYAYGPDFQAAQAITLKTAPTFKGLQTAAYSDGHWWFGCYGRPEFTEVLIRTDHAFGAAQVFAFDASTGLVPLDGGAFLVARAACGKESCVARLAPARLGAWIHSGRLKPL